MRPVLALYGHCAGYNMRHVIHNVVLAAATGGAKASPDRSFAPPAADSEDGACDRLEIADVYLARPPTTTSGAVTGSAPPTHGSVAAAAGNGAGQPAPPSAAAATSAAHQAANASPPHVAAGKRHSAAVMFRGFDIDLDEGKEGDAAASAAAAAAARVPSRGAALSRFIRRSQNKWSTAFRRGAAEGAAGGGGGPATAADRRGDGASVAAADDRTASSVPTGATFAFLSSATFAHVVLRVIVRRDNSTSQQQEEQSVELGTVGLFSNGAVVAFGLGEEEALRVIRQFRDCERQDPILYPERGAWKALSAAERMRQPVELTAVQALSYVTIADLSALGFDMPSEIDADDGAAHAATTTARTTTTAAATDQQQQQQQIEEQEEEDGVYSDANDGDGGGGGGGGGGSSSAANSADALGGVPQYMGYFDVGELGCIVTADRTVEAQLPFMLALAEAVQVDALAAALAPVAARSHAWREAVRRSSRALCRIAPKREVRVSYLQTLRLAAVVTRAMSGRSGVFWTRRHAPQRVTYECAYEHLDVAGRLAVLQRHIETVTETVSYLGEELRHDTDERLEWAIIVLIVASLVTALVV